MSIKDAFEDFLTDEEAVKEAIASSTRASWGGSGYSVELFDDGTRRVLGNQMIGNLYNSAGMIIPIPALSSEEWDEDPTIRYYDDALENLKDIFEEKWQEKGGDRAAR